MAKQNKYILSIDQGTTSSRGVIFDKSYEIVSIGQREFTQFFPNSGWVEHDPEEIWMSTLESCRNAIKESKIDLTKLYAADPPAPSKPAMVKSKGPSKRDLKKAQAAEMPKPTKARQEADKRREARLARVAEEEAAALKREKNAARAKKAAATRAKNKRAKAKAAKDAKNSK